MVEREKIRIALVDDHTLFRSGLRGLLSMHEGFEVVADVSFYVTKSKVENFIDSF